MCDFGKAQHGLPVDGHPRPKNDAVITKASVINKPVVYCTNLLLICSHIKSHGD